MVKKYKYIYGPVPSWRLGKSLGVDPISTREKNCPFNCTYCQLGKSVKYETERKIFVPAEDVIAEVSSIPDDVEINYITMSGRGEPTLAKNLGEIIFKIKKIRKKPVAVITDSALINLPDVRSDLMTADFVMAKLDAPDEEIFRIVNRPAPGITLFSILEGLRIFRNSYKGKFSLQIMLLESNKNRVKEIALLARQLNPDEVQLNTPLRPCAEKPLSRDEINNAMKEFEGMNTITVYDGFHGEVKPISTEEALYRRGKRL